MSQLNNNSFSIMEKLIKNGYNVVGVWENGVVVKKDDKIELVPYNSCNSAIGYETKLQLIESKKDNKITSKYAINNQMGKLVRNKIVSKEQAKSYTMDDERCK